MVLDDVAVGVDGQGGGGQPELFVDLFGHAVLAVVGMLASVGDDNAGVGVEGRQACGQ